MFEYHANCVGVYDGDTITVDIDLGFDVWMHNQKIRLNGINAPELHGENRKAGLEARDYLRSLVIDKNVTIVTHKARGEKEKYGRWLADVRVQCDNCPDATAYLNVNDKMVSMGHAWRMD